MSRIAAAAFIVTGVYYLAQGAIKLADLWMLVFGAVLFAVVIRSIADPLVAKLKLPQALAVFVAVLAILTFLAGAGFLFGAQITDQVEQLMERLPSAWAQAQGQIRASPIAGQVFEQLKSLGSQAGQMLAIAPRFAMGAVSGVTTLFLVLVAGVVLAGNPARARDGVLALAPKARRERLGEVMDTCGLALKGWLKAQVLSMLLVGSMVTIGLALIGVPAPLALGLLTGLAQFVPIIGPIASAVPALLVAATGGAQMLWLSLALYVGVSQLESNVITPLVQKNLASLPVVLGIFSVVGLGTLFGPLGVLFATPLTLTLLVIVTMLYRQDVLGDRDALAPGQRRPAD